MKKIGYIVLVVLCVFLSACSSKDYEKDTGKGKIESITLEEMAEKMEDGDSFAVALTQDMCGYCAEYHEMLKKYIQNHKITMYEVNLTKEPRSENENVQIIHKYFPTFNSTPGIYYANEGNVVNSLTDDKKAVNEQLFDEWVQKNKMDRKK